MSWGEIFFGFHGRINRRTYWIVSILLAIAGLLFNALLAYLATGNAFAPEVWQRPADKSAIWMPVWLAYFLFLAWPTAALSVKRLHDRDRPAWLWYTFYAATIVLSLIPLRGTAGAETTEIAGAATIILMIFAAYIMFELSVLRGTPGPNAFGEDPMPPGYYGGDYSFWTWMLALEGRISRGKWWLGVAILAVIAILASIAMGLSVNAFMTRYPEFEQNLSNPEWVNSPEAAPLVFRLGLWTLLPSLAFIFVIWSMLALGVKRLHDRGLSSWLILVVVLPLIGALIAPGLALKFDLGESIVRLALLLVMASVIWSILQFGIFKGETGPNAYGPDPRAGRR
jgi:uncharacterized membrane protein YhaH (DUF805 family)